MYFDYFTTAALVDELNEALAGGRIQDIVEIDDLALGLEIYKHQQRHYLFMAAYPEQARVHLTEGKLRRGVMTPSPLGLLLHRYIEGGRIAAVRQPAWERIILLDVITPDAEYTIVVEPIERRANILLVENGIIRECIHRVGANENRVRQLLPGQPYQPPPPQKKIDPADLTLEDVKKLLDDETSRAYQALTRGIHGVSPQLAREIVFQAVGKIDINASDTSARDIFAAIPPVLDPLLDHEWQPGYTEENGEITAYSVYPLTHRAGWKSTPSISAALEKFYGVVSGEEAYEAAKKPIRAQIEGAHKRLKSKLASLQRQTRDDSDIERLKQSGELLLAYQYQVKKGDTILTAQYDPEGDPLQIKLDPLLSPVENAKRYFEKYDKAKRSRQSVPEMIALAQNELDYLDQLAVDLDLATNWPEIGEVQDALQESGYWKGRRLRQTTERSTPIKVVTENGIIIWIGRNARQNEHVTFEKGTADDVWLHARGVGGAHVIIKTGGQKISDQVLSQAAELAAYYSAARKEGKVEVIITERRHVRKIKGGKTGMVRVMQETHPTLRVTPKAQ